MYSEHTHQFQSPRINFSINTAWEMDLFIWQNIKLNFFLIPPNKVNIRGIRDLNAKQLLKTYGRKYRRISFYGLEKLEFSVREKGH